ncbi:MAG: hypothetical protein HY644_04205 [Acidobacteria bacterium]|nr:hypothetical protein [Acidobacteriota bacterium]
MRSESGKVLANKKNGLEQILIKIISDFENETGLSVTEVRFIRPEVAGGAEPTLGRILTTVELITG